MIRARRNQNDPGSLQGARHRPRTSGGVTNRSSPSRRGTPTSIPRPRTRDSQRSASGSPAPKLPPLSNGGRTSNNTQDEQVAPKSVVHPYAKTYAKPLRSRTPLPTDKPIPKNERARIKRCTRHFDKMRQYAYVRNSKLTDMFMKYNHNGDNVIDYEEFLLMLNRMNMDKFLSVGEMREMFDFADPDGSGGIDINEFNEIFEAQEPLMRRNRKKQMLMQSSKQHKEFAANFATPEERQRALTRAAGLQDMVATKLLQKKSASFGNNVRQDGRMFYMAYKQLDRDGDGVVTYDEFKESFGPKGFDLGLSDGDMKDLILAIDQEATGFIECSDFLQRLRESDKPSGKDPFHDHAKEVRQKMGVYANKLTEFLKDPSVHKTTVDGLEPVKQEEDSKLQPEVPEAINPFSAAELTAKKSGAAKKWEKPTVAELARRQALARQRAHTAKLLTRLKSTPHWQSMAENGAGSFKTVQQQRIVIANNRKKRETAGTFQLSYNVPKHMKVHTYKSKACSPKPQDTFQTVGYGRDDSSPFAKPDSFDDKAVKYARRRARAKINHAHKQRIWKYRRDKDVLSAIQDAARIRSKLQQREAYMAAAAKEGDRLYKAYIGRKGMYDSEISQRQRFGNFRHFGPNAADGTERYSGGPHIPL